MNANDVGGNGAVTKRRDFVLWVLVDHANPSGDPLYDGRPRQDLYGFGYMTAECIRRKIRDRLQDMGRRIFVQQEKRADDGCRSLKERADKVVAGLSREDALRAACAEWSDVRIFGQTFAFRGGADSASVSMSVTGPVSIQDAYSVDPVIIESTQITKSVNGSEPKAGSGKDKGGEADVSDRMSSDRMGMRHRVRFGVYKICGSINVQACGKTGMSEADADDLKEALRSLFVNDASAGRPAGSMDVLGMYWITHDSALGKYSARKVFDSVWAKFDRTVSSPYPSKLDDYTFGVDKLEGLDYEEVIRP